MSKNITRCFPSSFNTPHIFLSGKKGCGKTTIIQSVLTHLEKHIKVNGFTTLFDIKSQHEKILYISPAQSSLNDAKKVMDYLNGSIIVHSETFDTFGVSLLNNAKESSLIIMDELGRFEKDCEKFKNAVFECLNGNIPILGVLQMQEGESWLDEIKEHQKVTVLDIDRENRNEIEKEIRHILFNRFEE